MTVKSSLTLSQKLKPARRKNCNVCGLYLNQAPVFDHFTDSVSPQVFWVGLSAVRFNVDDEMLPLSAETRSGALIERIEIPLRRNIKFYKTNLVKCLPLRGDKIRYPLRKEMEKCCPNFDEELAIFQPSVVFLLGKQVASFVLKKLSNQEFTLSKDFQYQTFSVAGITYIPVHHPSYILVYRRKYIDKYIQGIRHLCMSILEKERSLLANNQYQ